MIKKVSIITIIAVVVASLAVVAFARYQRSVYPAIARGLSVATDGGGLSNLEADTLIAADKATAALEFAKGSWINSDPLKLEKLRGHVVLVEFENHKRREISVARYGARNPFAARPPGLTPGASDMPPALRRLVERFLQGLKSLSEKQELTDLPRRGREGVSSGLVVFLCVPPRQPLRPLRFQTSRDASKLET